MLILQTILYAVFIVSIAVVLHELGHIIMILAINAGEIKKVVARIRPFAIGIMWEPHSHMKNNWFARGLVSSGGIIGNILGFAVSLIALFGLSVPIFFEIAFCNLFYFSVNLFSRNSLADGKKIKKYFSAFIEEETAFKTMQIKYK